MRLKKIIFSLVLVVLWAFPFFDIMAQQTAGRKIVRMHTISIRPLNVTFFPSNKNRFRGQLLGDKIPSNVRAITFYLEDMQGAEVWHGGMPWDSKYLTDGKVVIPFDFDFSDNGFSGKFKLKAELLNNRNTAIAKGDREVSLFGEDKNSQISNLKIEKGNQEITGTFKFINGSKKQDVYYEIQVFEHSIDGEIVLSKKGETEQLGIEEEKEFKFSIFPPKRPETYILQVQIRNSSHDLVTGVLRDRFLIEGDFAEITMFESNQKKYLNENDSVIFTILGVAVEKKGELEIVFSANQKEDEDVIWKLTEKKPIKLNYGEFEVEFPFKLEHGAMQFDANVKIIRDGVIIEEKNFTTPLFKKPAVPMPEVVGSILNDEGGNQKLIIGGVLLIIVVLLVIFLVIIGQKNKINLLIFIPLIFFLEVPNAFAGLRVNWRHPIDTWAYTHDDTNGFDKIKFYGDIVDETTGTPLFEYNKPTLVQVAFYKVGETEATATYTVYPKSSRSPEIGTVIPDDEMGGNNAIYSFEIQTPSNLGEDDWVPDVIFEVPGYPDLMSTYWADPDGECPDCHISIDETPPNVTFSYKTGSPQVPYVPGTFTNLPVGVTVRCEDVGGAGCLEDTVPFNTFNVSGNFCDDSEKCNTTGTREFNVCDKIGNCTLVTGLVEMKDDNGTPLNFYDPIPPKMNFLKLWRGSINFLAGDSLEAHGQFNYETDSVDNNRADDSLFDTHACGEIDSSSPFYHEDENKCTQKQIACSLSSSKRGIITNQFGSLLTPPEPDLEECVGECGPGLVPVGDECLSECATKFPLCFPFTFP